MIPAPTPKPPTTTDARLVVDRQQDDELREAHARLKRAISGGVPVEITRTPRVGTAILARAAKLVKAAGNVLVLHVEDESAMIALLRETSRSRWIMGDLRLELRAVETLGEALKILRPPHAFDVILLDLCLPDATEYQALDAIRLVDPTTPVVVFSGIPFDPEEASRHGATVCLHKGGGVAEVFPALASAILQGEKKAKGKT